MEEKVKQKRLHKMHMENRNKLDVSRLSVEKGELDIDGTIESYAYSEVNSYAKKGESMLGRLFR